MKKATPVLCVEAIEPCLAFWAALGFERKLEVPEGDQLGFVILARDNVEIMYQSRRSLARDLPELADTPSGGFVYIEVSRLGDVLPALKQADVLIKPRVTFYGATEIFVREPGGHVIAFAAHDPQE